jgi:hypothetical protein
LFNIHFFNRGLCLKKYSLALFCVGIHLSVILVQNTWGQTNSAQAVEAKAAPSEDLKLQDVILKPFPFVLMQVVDGGALLKFVRNDTQKPYFLQVNAVIADPDWAGYKLISFTPEPIPTVKFQKGSGKQIDLPLGKAVFSDVLIARLWNVSSLQMYTAQAGGSFKGGEQTYEVVSVEANVDGKPKVVLKKAGMEIVPPLIEGEELAKLRELLKSRQAEAEKKRAEEAAARQQREAMYKEYPYLRGTYRMSEAAIAQKRARDEKKLLVWMSSALGWGKPPPPDLIGGSHIGFIELMKFLQTQPVVVVFHDGYTETHQEPLIVDKALRTPVVHYTPPRAIILNPSITKVLGSFGYNENSSIMMKECESSLAKALSDKTWLEEEEKLPYPPVTPKR